MITYRMAVIHCEGWWLVASTNVVWVLVSTVSWSIFMRVLVTHSSRGWGYPTLRSGITSILLVYLWKHVFALANLWRIFHAIGLLDEEHASMILWSLDNFWPRSSILIIDIEILIWLWALWTIWIVVLTGLLLHCLLILWFRCSISCPESSKTWTIHLFLQKIARISVMNITL
jgi:hypothetical protein